jgi:O-antigen/teichoic acid export membrane protein
MNLFKDQVPINLTKKAGWTFASNLMRQGAQILVGFVVTPIVIRGLGAELYGALQMIEQAVQYIARSDLRPMGTLRVFLSVRQHSVDHQEKKRLVGAALSISLAMLPLLLLAGACLSWAAPSFIKVSPDYVLAVQYTMGIAVLRIALDKVLGIPGSVLAGVNLEYKAMGLSAGTVLVSGALSALAINVGWGLVGVACAAVAGVLLNGVIRLFVACKNVPWFGVARPTRPEFFGFTKSSGWFFGSSIADAFLNVSDLLIIGMVLGPAAAGVYAATGAVLRMVVAPVSQVLSSASAGIGELCGKKDWRRVVHIRQEMFVIVVVVMTVIGTGVIAFNKAFLGLWIGDGFYSGDWVNITMVLIALVKVLVRSDSLLLDNLLVFKERSVAFIICGIFTLCSGVILTYHAGEIGMALSVFAGQFGLYLYCCKLINQKLGKEKSNDFEFPVKIMVVPALLIFSSYIINVSFKPHTYLTFFPSVIVFSLISSLILWKYGISESDRGSALARMRSILPR